MMLAFRSHLPSHPVQRHLVGAGLIRTSCTICPHLEIEDAPRPEPSIADGIPAWMAQASVRFEVGAARLAVA